MHQETYTETLRSGLNQKPEETLTKGFLQNLINDERNRRWNIYMRDFGPSPGKDMVVMRTVGE